jgi:hypothetical protein
LRYVAWGLALSLGGEFLNQIIVHHSIKGYFSTLALYAVLLFIAYGLQMIISKLIEKKNVREIFEYCLFGSAGLMIEWFLIGNAPWDHTGALQIGMFTWWACLWVMPHLLLETSISYDSLKKSFWRFFIPFTLSYLIISTLIPTLGINFGIIIYAYGTVVVNYFFVRYVMAISIIEKY